MLVIAILSALLLSAFFSGSEIAFISASKLEIELKRSDGSRRGRILAAFYDRPEQFLAVMLVGNNIVLVIFTYLMSLVLEPVLEPYISSPLVLGLIQTLLITAVVLVFGEYLPKTLFRLFANQLLHAFTYLLWFFKQVFAIPASFMKGLSTLFLKYILRVPTEDNPIQLTRYDLEEFVEGQAEDSEEELETEMFKNALHLKQTRVRSCMVPRNEIRHIDVSAGILELSKLFQETKHSRIIVTNGDLDDILGYVHHQQLIKMPSSIRKILLDIDLVPEAMSVQDLMLKFIKEGTNMAYVVDEFGGTSGLITLEDTLEEIFGEIEDEHDAELHVEEQIDERHYRLSGRLELQYINEQFPDLHLPEGEYTTLSGYIVMTEGNIPEEGEEVEIGQHRFTIEKVADTKVEIVRVELLEVEEDEDS
jgi:CBS domain containing-hemolysin-like protein